MGDYGLVKVEKRVWVAVRDLVANPRSPIIGCPVLFMVSLG
jgi:hypothetical protein